jgi:hypothetical protein
MLARVSTSGWPVLSCALARPGAAQIAPRILHDGLECIVAGQHAVVEALVEPTDDLVTVKVYFRAEIYPAFFFVEAAPSTGSSTSPERRVSSPEVSASSPARWSRPRLTPSFSGCQEPKAGYD